ncbi:MAG: hypothetical protein SVU32_03645 [Candidatus Nanohaloarchaea archaeon]|nr:hypothetical protein [Candidatus Nanohaloarchaea archaeon]
MYHPAKVDQVVDATDGILRVTTWDRNTFTLAAAPDLDVDGVEEGDVVLLDYYPDESYDIPSPKQVVSHVLRGEKGEELWEDYEQLYEESQEQQTAMNPIPNQPFDGNYIG